MYHNYVSLLQILSHSNQIDTQHIYLQLTKNLLQQIEENKVTNCTPNKFTYFSSKIWQAWSETGFRRSATCIASTQIHCQIRDRRDVRIDANILVEL